MLSTLFIFPDWNSLESVRNAHNVLEAGALIFFAALVVLDVLANIYEDSQQARAKLFVRIGLCCFAVAVLAEILAYPYSRRNDLLSERQNSAQKDEIAILEREAANAKAEQLKVEIALNQQREKTANAERALLEVKQKVEQRALSKEQRAALASALSVIPKIPIAISCVEGHEEECTFAEEFKDIFVSCGWEIVGDSVSKVEYREKLAGFFLHVRPNSDAPSERDVPPSAVAIQEIFTSIGIRLPISFAAFVPGASVEIVIAGKILSLK
jgi:hypothetical protein